ncbi:MAG: flagellar hook-length control protein FliK [Pseudomonadota bacterium]
MLPRTDLNITAVGRIEAPAAVEAAVDARQQAFQRSLATMLGKELQADILSKFNDGSFLVKVANATARMQLPANTQVGAQVALTLVALEPRPTFEIHSQPGTRAQADVAHPETDAEADSAPAAAPSTPRAARAALAEGQPLATPAGARGAHASLQEGVPAALPAAPRAASLPLADALPMAAPAGAGAPSVGSSVHAAALLGKAPLIAAADLPPLDSDSLPATLSAAGKVLASVLGTARQAGAVPPGLVGRAPLLDGPPLAPQQLATALKDALANSGLFYESHLAEWASGTRTRAQLGQEPQMQRAHLAQRALAVAAADAAPAPAEGAPRPAPIVADAASAQLIDLQLQTHEQARVAWQGQPWPGQAMQWDIVRQPSERDGSAGGQDGAEAHWQSSVRLRFAALGDIGARLNLAGGQLHIHLDAPDDAIGALLRAHAGALASALEAAGTPLAALTIRAAQEGP